MSKALSDKKSYAVAIKTLNRLSNDLKVITSSKPKYYE